MSQEDRYWIQLALDEFHSRVWERGLGKYALDLRLQESSLFSYGSYSIMVCAETPKLISISINVESQKNKLVFYYSVDKPDSAPIAHSKTTLADIALLEEIIPLWAENFFSRV